MIWVTWRQHRAALLFGLGILVALCLFLFVTGHGIWHEFRASGAQQCIDSNTPDCEGITSAFTNRYNGYQLLIPLFLLLPALLGVFWGAPLVAREVEHGTHRLAWTQAITRRRWIVTKCTILLGSAVAGAAIFTYVLAWWSRPFVSSGSGAFQPGIFDLRGFVPLAYALFAVALGLAAGTIMQRMVSAMGITLVGYAGVRAAITLFARQHFAAAKHIAYGFPFEAAPTPKLGPNAWEIATKTVDAAGHFLGRGITLNLATLAQRCPDLGTAGGALPGRGRVRACAQHIGLQIQSMYQPGSRYWSFQAIESAIFVALAAALIALSLWWIRRRVS
jgi:hypothetical protein